jgi:hypothetical protein
MKFSPSIRKEMETNDVKEDEAIERGKLSITCFSLNGLKKKSL